MYAYCMCSRTTFIFPCFYSSLEIPPISLLHRFSSSSGGVVTDIVVEVNRNDRSNVTIRKVYAMKSSFFKTIWNNGIGFEFVRIYRF